MAETVADLSIVIRARNAAKAVLSQVKGQFGGLIKQAEKYRDDLESISKKLLLVGAVATGLFIGSAVVFNNLEQEMASVQKTTGLVRSEIKLLETDFVDLSKRIPVSAKELASIGAIAGQLGIKGRQDILLFTETIAQVSTVTEFASEAAAESLARLANIFKIPIKDVGRLAGVINELENTTTAKAPVIADFLQRLAVSSTQIGLTASETAGLSATLIDLGFKAELAGTAVSATFTQMITNADKFGAQMGLTAVQFRASLEKDAIGTIIRWAESIQNLPTEQLIAQFDEAGISGTRALQVFGALTSGTEKLRKNVSTATGEFKKGTSLIKEFSVFIETTWKQTEILRNKLTALAIFVGETLNPVWRAAVVVLGFFVDLIDKLPDFFKRNLVVIGTFASVLAVVAGAVGLLILAIKPLLVALAGLVAVAAPFAPILVGIGVVISSLLIAFTSLGRNSDEVKEKIKSTGDASEKFGEKTKALTNDQKALKNQLQQTSKELTEVEKAFKTLDLKSGQAIQGQIDQIKNSLETLRSSGQLSFDDLARAEARAEIQTRQLMESFQPEKIAKTKTQIEKITSALLEMDNAQLRVLEKQREILSVDLSQAEKRVADIQSVIDIENELESFQKEIRNRGLTDQQRGNALLSDSNEKLRESFSTAGKERIELLRQAADAAQKATKSFVDGSWRQRIALSQVTATMKELAEETKNQKNLDLTKSTKEQFQEALKNLEDVRVNFKNLQEEIADIQAVVRIVERDQLIADANRLRGDLVSKFSIPIIQKVLIQQSGGSATGRPQGLNLDPQFEGSSLPSFATGIRFVPRDMVAQIHRGETVLNKSQANDFRQGRNGGITVENIHLSMSGDSSGNRQDARNFARMVREELQRVDERSSN